MSKANKKAYIISCSDHYGHRLWAVDNVLREMGYDTVYITSDFDHNTKQPFVFKGENSIQIHAKPYKKNLSLDRILSHMFFSRDVFAHIEKCDEPDLIYALIPPNFIAHYGAKYKRKHKNVKLVFDIFDLWPETFPSGKIKKLLAPVFGIWSSVRDKALPKADFVITECEMFREKLKLSENSQAVFLSQKPLKEKALAPNLPEDKINLCYLGAINNIISIPHIAEVIKKIVKEKPVALHIIGAGERLDELIAAAENAGAEVVYHGPIFDNDKKQEIISRCHFGLNIMKESVCIGLTMKSVDYFCHGLPIINNIPADTHRLVTENNIGVCLDDEDFCQKVLAGNEACLKMRENVKRVFSETFEESVIKEKYHSILSKL